MEINFGTHLGSFTACTQQCVTSLQGPSGCIPTKFVLEGSVTILKYQMAVCTHYVECLCQLCIQTFFVITNLVLMID